MQPSWEARPWMGHHMILDLCSPARSRTPIKPPQPRSSLLAALIRCAFPPLFSECVLHRCRSNLMLLGCAPRRIMIRNDYRHGKTGWRFVALQKLEADSNIFNSCRLGTEMKGERKSASSSNLSRSTFLISQVSLSSVLARSCALMLLPSFRSINYTIGCYPVGSSFSHGAWHARSRSQ